jgi:hypothetical protein
MTNFKRAVIAIVCASALAGCASVKAVNGQYEPANSYSVTLQRSWSDLTSMIPGRPKNVRLLSVDGVALNQFYLASLAEGESLVRPTDRDTPRPTFSTDMSEGELVEFVVDCVANMGYQAPEATALRPQAFAAAAGVRFELSTRTASGLNISGSVLIARRGERLNVLLFLAPEEHYYNSLLPDVEAAFASAA